MLDSVLIVACCAGAITFCSISNIDYNEFDHCLNTIVAQTNESEVSLPNDVTKIFGPDSDYDNVLNKNEDTEIPNFKNDIKDKWTFFWLGFNHRQ